jgi:DNA-binding response OmpR family regulator
MNTLPLPLLLIVEDEEIIREILGDALTEAGFEIALTVSGTQAMSELDANAAKFRGLITDVKLGDGLDGWAVARRARELVHDIPVVYMSGDSAHEWSSKGVPNSVMLGKPFAPAQIVTAISTLMNKVDEHRMA